jgi:MFS family permease
VCAEANKKEIENGMFNLREIFPGLLPLFVLSHFTHHLLTALPVPLLPMIRSEFSLDYAQSGVVISAFSLAYGFGQLPAGWLSDRFGPKLMITVGVSGVALAGFLVGFLPFYLTTLIFLAMMGVMGGGYHPSAPPVISALVNPEKRGQALGLHNIGGSASYFLSPIVATAIAAAWGWRASFISLAVPTMIFGILLYILLGRHSLSNSTEKKEETTAPDAPPNKGPTRHLIVFLILSMVTTALSVSITSFIPLFVVDNFHISKKTAGALLGFIYSAGLWVGPLTGHLSDRLGRIPMMLAIGFAGGPVCYLLTIMPYGWGFYALLITIGIMLYTRMTVTESYIVGQTSEHNRSTVFGIYYFGAIESGGLLTPAVGYGIDNFGFTPTYIAVGAASVLFTLVCAVPLWGSQDN